MTALWEIRQGDVLERLREMPDESVQCVVTSPPYFGLRDYGITGQIGLEKTLTEYVCAMVEVFREVRRVLRSDGVCWLNLGDSYARAGGWSDNSGLDGLKRGESGRARTNMQEGINGQRLSFGMKSKDLMMIPARIAIALQDDGWYVRSEIVWCKRAPMPESVTDRPTSATEKIYLLTKSERYFYDQEAVRETRVSNHDARVFRGEAYVNGSIDNNTTGNRKEHGDKIVEIDSGRNQWNYWLLSPDPNPDAHFATFPTEIPRRCIAAGTSERGCCPTCGAPWRRVLGDAGQSRHGSLRSRADVPTQEVSATSVFRTGIINHTKTTGWEPSCKCPPHEPIPCTVLDCFSGSGTTVMVALRLGRRGLGIELQPDYVAMSIRRITQDCPMFNTPLEAVS